MSEGIRPICRPCLRRITALQNQHPRHSFATSVARRKHGALPAFSLTPSEDLNTLLSTIRTNIFLPSHLIKPQRDLLYRKKNHSLLTSDEPATVRLGFEVLQLLPLNHQSDEPNTRTSFAKILDLMGESGDWRNLPSLMEGLKTARRSIKAFQIEKLVRRANVAGQQGVVMELLKRVDKTGVGIWDLSIAKEVMLGAVLKGVHGNWSQSAAERACRYAEAIWELIWDPGHSDGAKKMGSDIRRAPEVLGYLVLVHAVRARQGGEGEVEMVRKHVQLMLKDWERADLNVDVEEGDWYHANNQLKTWAPVWQALKLAQEYVDKPTGQLVAKAVKDLKKTVMSSKSILEEHRPINGPRRGLGMYEDMVKLSP